MIHAASSEARNATARPRSVVGAISGQGCLESASSVKSAFSRTVRFMAVLRK